MDGEFHRHSEFPARYDILSPAGSEAIRPVITTTPGLADGPLVFDLDASNSSHGVPLPFFDYTY